MDNEIPFTWPTKMLAQLLLKIRKCLGFATFQFRNLCRDTTRSDDFLITHSKKPQGEVINLGFPTAITLSSPTTSWFFAHNKFLFDLVMFYISHKKIRLGKRIIKANLKDDQHQNKHLTFWSYTKIKIKTVFPSGEVLLTKI